MQVWQPLPENLAPEVRRLAVRLREIKDAAGPSLDVLARKTPASRSAWGRYFNGQAVPPREVVVALAELADVDRHALLALWELADHAHRHRVALPRLAPSGEASKPDEQSTSSKPAESDRRLPSDDDAPSGPPTELPRETRRATRRHRVAAALAVAAGVAAGGLGVGLWTAGPSSTASSPQKERPRTSQPVVATGQGCQDTTCEQQPAGARGCESDAVTATVVRVDYALVQLRYSRSCRALWGLLKQGRRYDRVEIAVGGHTAKAKVLSSGGAASTPMLAAPTSASATVCASLTTGARQCGSAPA
ncbi:helix-turn-helix domain-containing protein [Actinomadura oligospora]|uniref:helix-turn-helix domain-containing protein n=1 Tax=Actinomadura oligospora TaxID=111804 RepID=UPI00047D16E0|nr:XRE family transcriptional regulator [Actinomadura oligospora]